MYLSLCKLVVLFLLLESCHCKRMLKVVPGAGNVTFYNKQYVKDIVFNTRRYSRKSDYVVNLEFTTLVAFDNNMSISVIFYEYLHNEYRRSFVELHFNLCELILKDPLLGAVVRKTGFTICPIPPDRYRLMNMSFDQEFPNLFPFEKGKGELIVKLQPSGQLVAKGDLQLTFKQKEV